MVRAPLHVNFTEWTRNPDASTRDVSDLSYQQLHTERQRLLRLLRKGINTPGTEERFQRVEQRINNVSTN